MRQNFVCNEGLKGNLLEETTYTTEMFTFFRNVPDITLNDSFWILIACFFHGTKSPAKVRNQLTENDEKI